MSNLPFIPEDFLASVVEALKIRGDARTIAALIEGECNFQIWDSDFGIDYWRLFLALPVHIFYALSEEERKLIEESIVDVGSGKGPDQACRQVDYCPRSAYWQSFPTPIYRPYDWCTIPTGRWTTKSLADIANG